MVDCFTCQFANRDEHNRYESRCSGFGNCSYMPFEGKIDPTPLEQMEELIKGEHSQDFKAGVKACIEILENE